MTKPSTPAFAPSAEELIIGFATNTMTAATLLYKNNLLGQMLLIIYSAIDTMGLLDAPPAETKATGALFKNWVKTHLLPEDSSFEFNEVDLWGARCGVLHTFTTASDLSDKGSAKQLHYFAGDKTSELAQTLPGIVQSMEGGGKHVAANLDDMLAAFGKATAKFARVLDGKCQQDAACEARLRSVLQQHFVP